MSTEGTILLEGLAPGGSSNRRSIPVLFRWIASSAGAVLGLFLADKAQAALSPTKTESKEKAYALFPKCSIPHEARGAIHLQLSC